jgi:2'-5' RNA ligase
MGASGNIRAFIALKPPASWAEELGQIQATLKRDLGSRDFKWVEPEQIHITLRFLGSVPGEQVDSVKNAMTKAAAGFRSFPVRASGLGCFPSANSPRVLWMGIEEEGATLAAKLQRAIEEETAPFGEPPETRPFSPHLTLARVKEADRDSRMAVQRVVQKPWAVSGEWLVSEVLLMQSHLSSGGARYETLHSTRLE